MSDERSFEDELRLTLMAARGIAEPDHICPACDGWKDLHRLLTRFLEGRKG